MHSVRLARVAVMLGMLGCGSDEPVIAERSEEQEQSPVGEVDAGSPSGNKKDAGKQSAPKPPDEEPAISSSPKSDAAVEEENCGEDNVRTGPVVPDIMIVLDRSGSMRPDENPNLRCDALDQLDPITQGIRFGECLMAGINCDTERDKMTVNCGGTALRSIDRWTPSVAAIKKLTTEFDDDVSFGLITFPGQGGGRGNNGSCTPGSLQVPVGLGKAAAINMVLGQTQPGGGTPTGEALQTALTEFRKLDTADGVRPARYVLLVTDGQPTCPNGGGGMRQNGAAADKKLTLDALDALAKDGVKTYVIGYDAALDPALASALTEFAQHGGTERYYAVQDEMSLAEAFKSISTAVIRCDIELAFKAWRPDYLHVILDGNELKAGDPDGYRLEGQTVFLEGAACAALQEGKGHRVEVTMDCVGLL